MSIHTLSLLRRALALDAVASGAMAFLLILGAGPLSALFGLPSSFLLTVGIVLLPWSAWVGWLASRMQPPRGQVWLVIGLNALWVLDTAILLFAGPFDPTTLGTAFAVAQAVAVGVFAELQFIGVRRASHVTV